MLFQDFFLNRVPFIPDSRMLHGPGFSEAPPEGWGGVDFPGDGIVRQIQVLT